MSTWIIVAIVAAVALIATVAWLNLEPNLSQSSRIGTYIAAGRYEECAGFCINCDRKHLSKEFIFMLKRAKKNDKKYKYVFIAFLYRTIFGKEPRGLDKKYFNTAWEAIDQKNDLVDVERIAAAYKKLTNEL